MYLELLDVEDEGLAPRAWLEAAELAIEGKAPADLLKRKLGRLLSLLMSSVAPARVMAWRAAALLLRAAVVEPKELAERKEGLLELLRFRGPTPGIYADAWEVAEALAAAGLLSAKDLRPLSDVLWDVVRRSSGRERERLASIASRLSSAGLIRGPKANLPVLSEDSYIL